MHFLDICDDVLLEILLLVEPIDLVNISNVCERLRELAKGIINKVVLNLHLTGTDCFPNLKPQPFDNLDRIRVNKNWLDGKFSSKPLLQYNDLDLIGMFVDEHLYVAVKGAICKHGRLCNGEYLSSDFKLIGNKNHCEINAFAKKDNVIFAGCSDGSCMIFKDDKPVMKKKVSRDPFRAVDLFPKKSIYVAAFSDGVKLWNKRPNDETLLLVDDIYTFGMEVVKIDPSGKKLIMCTGGDHVTLYDFNTQIKEVCLELENPWDLLWKNNQTILSGHQDGSLRLFDLRTKSVSQRIDQPREEYIESIQFDGKNAAFCGFQCVTISICDLRMNKVLKEFKSSDKVYIPDFDTLKQIVVDPKHLFVMTSNNLNVCDFSV